MHALLLAVAASDTELTGISGWVADIIASLGAVGVGIVVALENLFPPIPSEVVLPLAGFTAARGGMDVIAAIVWATVGSVVGALALYGVGAALGRSGTRRVLARIPLMHAGDLDRADSWFVDHADRAVLLGRLAPVVRSLVSIPAGIARMPLPRFIGLTLLGSAIWNALFVWLGYVLGDQWDSVGRYSGVLNNVIIAVVVVVLAVFVVRRLRARRATSV